MEAVRYVPGEHSQLHMCRVREGHHHQRQLSAVYLLLLREAALRLLWRLLQLAAIFLALGVDCYDPSH